MGFQKKHGKNRLDKYYHMAKEQGYRARSAFKLIQLNKKYSFLEKAKCCIDLCAAPGGWLQVASKYMPSPSLIIGVDLVPIKPIPRVITLVQDITTDKCRAALRNEMKHFKADVVLHDGAPNVGRSWLHDAFTQNELTLSSLKLATEFLVKGGVFVTKVFRSKDYNKLLWVFWQLFDKVEATKPASSRNVSAEIFVVCTGFKSPDKLDPRFLDPKHVFREVDDEDISLADPTDPLSNRKVKEQQMKLLNDLFAANAQRRFRDGYEDGNYTMHKTISVYEFVTTREFVSLLTNTNEFVFTTPENQPEVEDQVQRIRDSKLTTTEVKECVRDLKVLGKKDFKTLIKWREAMRKELGLEKHKPAEHKKPVPETDETSGPKDSEVLVEELVSESDKLQAKLKRAKRKAAERKAKALKRMNLGMDTPEDIGLEANVNDMELAGGFGGEVDFGSDDEGVIKEKGEAVEQGDDSNDNEDENEDQLQRLNELEEEMENHYSEYVRRKAERDNKKKVELERAKAKYEEWNGFEDEVKRDKMANDGEEGDDESVSDSDSDSDSDFSSSDEEAEGEESTTKRKRSPDSPTTSKPVSKKAKMFFDMPVLKSIDSASESTTKPTTNIFSKDMTTTFDDSSDDDELRIRKMNQKAQSKKGKGKKPTDTSSDDEDQIDGFETVAATEISNPADDEYALTTAQAYTLAQQMISSKGKRDVIDSGYNRYAFNDPMGLPTWFLEDEGKHNKPTLPVTKEAANMIKERLKALNDRPIKKVAEAKARKKMKAFAKLQKIQKKMGAVVEDEETPDGAKAKEMRKLLDKAARVGKKKDNLPKLVVAKGGNRGIKGRPKGVKGRYKMVDPRMRKELRAAKAKAKTVGRKRK